MWLFWIKLVTALSDAMRTLPSLLLLCGGYGGTAIEYGSLTGQYGLDYCIAEADTTSDMTASTTMAAPTCTLPWTSLAPYMSATASHTAIAASCILRCCPGEEQAAGRTASQRRSIESTPLRTSGTSISLDAIAVMRVGSTLARASVGIAAAVRSSDTAWWHRRTSASASSSRATASARAAAAAAAAVATGGGLAAGANATGGADPPKKSPSRSRSTTDEPTLPPLPPPCSAARHESTDSERTERDRVTEAAERASLASQGGSSGRLSDGVTPAAGRPRSRVMTMTIDD